jgi:ribonuclease D
VAARRDAAPGRVLPDAAIITAAEIDPADERSLLVLPGFGGRSVRRLARTWLAALAAARELPEEDLPTTPAFDGPPPPHRWAERDPAAADRLARCRQVVTELATAHALPPENLITPDYVRRLAWDPPPELTPEAVTLALAGSGARRWQTELLSAPLAEALSRPPAGPTPPDQGDDAP